MANKFNPAPNPTNDPTYGQTSRAVERDVVVDRTFEAGLKGAAQILDTTVKSLDFKVKSDIDADLYKAIDEERDAFGVGDTAGMAAMAGSPLDGTKEGVFRGDRLPAEMNHLGPQVERMTQAYKAGKLSNRYYYARLESLVRSARARYPGYREYIDGKVAEITGVTPANALRSAILQDIENTSGQGKTEQDRRIQIVKELGKYVDDGITQQYLRGERSTEEYVYIGTRVQKSQTDLQNERNVYGLLGDREKHDENTVLKNLNNRGRIIMTDLMNRGTESIPGGLNAIEKQITAMQRGEVQVDAAEMEKYGPYIESVIRQARNTLRQEANTGTANAPAPSTYLSPKQVNDWIETQLADLYTWRDAIHNKDYGLIGKTARINKAIAEDDRNRILTDGTFGNFARKLTVWRELGGENMAHSFIMQNLNEHQKAIMSFVLPSIAAQDEYRRQFGKNFTFKDVAKVVKDLGANTPEMKERILDLAKLIHDPKASDKMSEEIASAIFSRGNYGFIIEEMPKGEQMDAFRKLTSDKILQRMTKLGGEHLENYKFWAKNEFTTLFRNHVNDANQLAWDRSVKLLWDDKTQQFTLDVNPDFPGATVAINNHVYKPIIDELNMGLKSIREIAKLDNDDVSSYLLTLMGGMGYRPGEGPPSTLMEGIQEILKRAVAGEAPSGTVPKGVGGRKG